MGNTIEAEKVKKLKAESLTYNSNAL